MIPRPGLSQSSVIAAAMIVAFFVFVTVRGELPYYLGVLTGKGRGTASATPSGFNSGFSGPGVGIGIGPGGISIGTGGINIGVGFPGGSGGPTSPGGSSICLYYPELCDPLNLGPGFSGVGGGFPGNPFPEPFGPFGSLMG